MSTVAHKYRGLIEADCNSCAYEKLVAQTDPNDPLAILGLSASGGFMGHPSMYSRCGNKRCPCAAHHDNECTNSNEPGQAGSLY